MRNNIKVELENCCATARTSVACYKVNIRIGLQNMQLIISHDVFGGTRFRNRNVCSTVD